MDCVNHITKMSSIFLPQFAITTIVIVLIVLYKSIISKFLTKNGQLTGPLFRIIKKGEIVKDMFDDPHISGKKIIEEEISSKINGLMLAGFFPPNTTTAFMINILVKHNNFYGMVFQGSLALLLFISLSIYIGFFVNAVNN